ncbi:myosin-5 [Anaeramoeba flamelloides]|uniref:Myosin-5 n=1 Tax=Anaeramoeba flamelloides TaxID=1746091 RepID=A0AAV8AF60_9EUKA|nr:myosin-5 [Anaeramoeba flamelloides]
MFKKKFKCKLQFGIILLSRVRQKNKTVFVKWEAKKNNGETKKVLLDKYGCAEWNQEFSINCSIKQYKKTKEFVKRILKLSIYFDIEKHKTRSLRRASSVKRIATLEINVAKGFSIKKTPQNKVLPIVKEYPLNLRNKSRHVKIPKILVAYKIQICPKEVDKNQKKKVSKLLNETYVLHRLEEYEMIKRSDLKSVTETEEYSEITTSSELMTDTENFEDPNSENWKEEIDEWEILEMSDNKTKSETKSNSNIDDKINIDNNKEKSNKNNNSSTNNDKDPNKQINNDEKDQTTTKKPNQNYFHLPKSLIDEEIQTESLSDNGNINVSSSSSDTESGSDDPEKIVNESATISLNDFLSPKKGRLNSQEADPNQKQNENRLQKSTNWFYQKHANFMVRLQRQNSDPLTRFKLYSQKLRTSKLNEMNTIKKNLQKNKESPSHKRKIKLNLKNLLKNKKEQQNSEILQRKIEYQKILKLENWLIERIFFISNSLYSKGYPISSCMIFKCFLYWKAFDPIFIQKVETNTKTGKKEENKNEPGKGKRKEQEQEQEQDKGQENDNEKPQQNPKEKQISEKKNNIQPKQKQELKNIEGEDILSTFLNSINYYLEMNKNEKEMLYWLLSNINFLIKLIQNYFKEELERGEKIQKKRKKLKQKQYKSHIVKKNKLTNYNESEIKKDIFFSKNDKKSLINKNKNYKIYNFQKQLKNLFFQIFRSTINIIFQEIQPNLINAFLNNNPNSSLTFGTIKQEKTLKKSKQSIAYNTILKQLNQLNEELDYNYLSNHIKKMFFNQIIHLMDVELTNGLLEFEQYCQCGNGFQIKLSVTQFEERLRNLNLGKLDNFSKIKQASECLAMNKIIINNKKDKYTAVNEISPELNYPQVLQLIKNFHIDEFDNTKIPKKKIQCFEKFIIKKLKKNHISNTFNEDHHHHFKNDNNLERIFTTPDQINCSEIDCKDWETITKPIILQSKKQLNFLDKDLCQLLKC